MALSASECYEAAMPLPPGVRKSVALRLLESLEITEPAPVHEEWTDEITSHVGEFLTGRVETIPGERVFADLAARRVARSA